VARVSHRVRLWQKQRQTANGKGKKSEKEPVISRIIARCKIEGTNEWEYLVHYKGRAESENRWVRSSQIDLPPHLKKRYRNTLKMRVTKKNNVKEPATPEVRLLSLRSMSSCRWPIY
jgi:hypothetical protein